MGIDCKINDFQANQILKQKPELQEIAQTISKNLALLTTYKGVNFNSDIKPFTLLYDKCKTDQKFIQFLDI